MKKIKYINNKEYTYVLSNDYRNEYDNKEKDLSIFEVEEWIQLLEISKIFEEAARNLNYETDDNYNKIDKKLIKSSQFLYYSPYCNYEDFNHMYYNTEKIEDIHKVVFSYVENGEKITLNHFRNWIIENYENLIQHKEYLQKINCYK